MASSAARQIPISEMHFGSRGKGNEKTDENISADKPVHPCGKNRWAWMAVLEAFPLGCYDEKEGRPLRGEKITPPDGRGGMII